VTALRCFDRHFTRWLVAGRTLSHAIVWFAPSPRWRRIRAQSIGFELDQVSTWAGVIDFIKSVAASPTCAPTALVTRQVSQAECRLEVPRSPITRTPLPQARLGGSHHTAPPLGLQGDS
jgi:hypothetical protein